MTNQAGNEVMVEELLDVKEDYFFNLKPDKEYKVEVSKPGFTSSFEYVSTLDIPYEDTLNQNLNINLPNKAMHRRPVHIINPTPCSVAALLPPRLGVYYMHWPR